MLPKLVGLVVANTG